MAMVAALGVVVVPLVLWLVVPGLVGDLESRDGFSWVAQESTGKPLLLREHANGSEILAGSDRFGIPAGGKLRCYDSVEPLLADALARGFIEHLSLRSGTFRILSITRDDLGSPVTTYVYRCGPDGALPLLSWGVLPEFGLRALAIAWLVWTVAWVVVLSVVRRSVPRVVALDSMR
jgi:hypothetical protein